MQIIKNYIPVTKAKSDLLNLVRQIENSDDAIAITKNGIPEAVLISMKKFQSLLETMEILADEKVMASIRKSVKQAKSGRWVKFGEVFQE